MGMKRLAELTIEDLTTAPVWRYEGGSGADAAVVAERRDSLSQLDDEIFLAATEFVLPDSSQHLGFCFPVDDAGIDYLQPVIVTPTAHVRFWFDETIAPEVLSAQWNALGRREEEIFPVRFRCRVPVDGRTVAGVIPNVETPASTSPAHRNPSELTGEVPDRSRRADGSAASLRPSRVRRSIERRAGIPEKRTAPRHRVEMMVEFDEGGSRVTGVTGEISRSGMFVRSARLPNGGPAVNLTVHLPGGRELLLKGRVVPNSAPADPARPAGFGLRLTEKPDEYDDFLSRLHDVPK
jgi:PilZ domain